MHVTYDSKQRTRLFEAVIDAPLPGNRSINKDCAHNMMAEVLNPTIIKNK